MSPVSYYQIYGVPKCNIFHVTWFQLLSLVQSFMLKAFIKKFLKSFSFYKDLTWFYDFFESRPWFKSLVRPGINIRYGHKALPNYWQFQVVKSHKASRVYLKYSDVGNWKANWGLIGLPLPTIVGLTPSTSQFCGLSNKPWVSLSLC